MNWLLIILGLGLVTLGAELLVRGASRLALRLGLSPMFVGLTLVGAGTSSPELAASVTASLRGLDDIAVGNIVGSNQFNLLLILGLAAAVCPIRISWRMVRAETFWMIAAALVPLAAFATGRTFGTGMGVAMLVGLVVYLWLSFVVARRSGSAASDEVPSTDKRPSVPVNTAFVVVGLGLLVWGSSMFVGAASAVGAAAGLSERVIGLTIVAAGTSMPELATSLVAAIRKHSALAVGNVLGSNVFNVLGILGVASIVRPQVFSDRMLTVDVPVMIGATLLTAMLLWRTHGVPRGWGVAMVVVFLVYVGTLIAG